MIGVAMYSSPNIEGPSLTLGMNSVSFGLVVRMRDTYLQ